MKPIFQFDKRFSGPTVAVWSCIVLAGLAAITSAEVGLGTALVTIILLGIVHRAQCARVRGDTERRIYGKLADAIDNLGCGLAFYAPGGEILLANNAHRAWAREVPALPSTHDASDPPRHELVALPGGRWLERRNAWTADRARIEMLTDVSATKQAQEKLRASEAQIQAMFRHSPSGLALKDRNGRYLLINEQLAQWLDLPADRVVGKDASVLYTSDLLDQIDSVDSRVLNGETVTDEFTLPAPGGRTRLIHFVKFPIWEDDAISTIGIISVDITDQREAEHRSRETEQQFEYLVERSPQGIMINRSLKMVFVNQAMVDLFGYKSREEVLALPSSVSIFAPHERERVERNAIARQRGAPAPVTYDAQVVRADGTELTVQITACRTRWQGEDAVLGFFQDVTERRRAREALLAAKEAAETASALKSQFLANVSHELRTPLNGVLGMLQLLDESTLNDKQKEHICVARRSGESLLELITDVLDLTKIEAGKLELERIEFDLDQIVDDAVQLVAERADDHGLTLTSIVDPSLPRRVVSDPVRIRQILVNLLGNAVKFTHHGKVRLQVSGAMEGTTTRLVFAVTDSGIGISADALDRIFEEFTQADQSTTRRFGGSGLGLAISRRIATALGGVLSAASEPGVGSTFELQVPVSLGREAYPPGAGSAKNTSQSTVLVAMSDPDERSCLLGQLLRVGVSAQEIEDTTGLRRALGSGRDSLVLFADPVSLRDPGVREVVERRHQAGRIRLVELVAWADRTGSELAAVEHQLHLPATTLGLREALFTAADNASAVELIPATGAGRRVLLAEDNLVNQKVATGMLEKLGYEVQVVSDGQAAVQAATAREFDALLMDCQMPILDGYAATRAIRAREAANQRRRLPIIALTANVLAGDRQRCLDAGMDDYLAKPLRTRDMASTLERWMRSARPAKLRCTA